jgi:hypothetical protein
MINQVNKQTFARVTQEPATNQNEKAAARAARMKLFHSVVAAAAALIS